jgi:hypothetical protein
MPTIRFSKNITAPRPQAEILEVFDGRINISDSPPQVGDIGKRQSWQRCRSPQAETLAWCFD